MGAVVILRRGDRFTDRAGETWQITDVRRNDVSLRHDSGITAKVSRRELASWRPT
jgi:hypothetical protein